MLTRKLGKRALLWGAVAANIPDIDVVAALWLPPYQNLLVHRGFTHSFLFALLLALVLAVLAGKWQKEREIHWSHFFAFFLIQFLTHDLLDTCNAYGTGLLEPFSQERFTFHLLYVADPLFTLWPCLGVAGLLLLRRINPARGRWVLIGLVPAVFYLGYAGFNKNHIKTHVTAALKQKQISAQRLFVTPTPFNNWLWYAVAATDSGYYVSNRSVFWPADYQTDFQFYPKQQQLLNPVQNQQEVQELKNFAEDGFYTVERWGGDTLVFNVLRFGQMGGWQNTKARFAFHYFLSPPEADNKLVMQRGRLKGWSSETIQRMLKYIFVVPKQEHEQELESQ